MENFEIYAAKFRDKAITNGFSEEIISKCLNYAGNLNKQNLPIIYNSYHLAGLVGYSHNYLTRSIISTEFFYRHFKIKKKDGNFREISEPLPSLKDIQYFILNEILYSQKPSKFCKSYIPKKHFKDYLRYHVAENEVLTLDIVDFFPSIKFKIIINFFSTLGYAKDVAYYLSCLITFTQKENKFDTLRFLPQGAPTSPYLSNLILKNFDDEVAEFCFAKKIKYTRYADDMAFSGRSIPQKEIIDFVKSKLLKIGLRLNEEKTNFKAQNEQQIISGVIVNRKLQIPKSERNRLRNVMYFIMKYGIDNHMTRVGENRAYYLSHLIGKIQYILDLNPKDLEFIKYKSFLIEEKFKNLK